MEEGDYLIEEGKLWEIYRKFLFPEETSTDKAEVTMDNGVLKIWCRRRPPRQR